MGCPEPAESAESAEPGGSGETGTAVVLGEIIGRLGKLEEQVAEFHRRAAHRESVIDRLHEEDGHFKLGGHTGPCLNRWWPTSSGCTTSSPARPAGEREQERTGR